jgi:hypothetical protein
VDVSQQRPADELDQTGFQLATRLALDVGLEVSTVDSGEGVSERGYLQWVLGSQHADQGLLICTKPLHRSPQGVRIRVGVPLYDLGSAVAERGRRRGVMRRWGRVGSILLLRRGLLAVGL